MKLPYTFREHMVFHVLQNDSRWGFYSVLFMQKLNSVYQNLYDVDSDFELCQIIEKMFKLSKERFFQTDKTVQNPEMKIHKASKKQEAI